ncbi:MAG: biotin--[acetyl-CoA-carboxylase] ligase [bacterium]
MQIIGKKIIKYPEIDSTNDEAKRLVKKGLGEGTVVIADTQTKGRGKPGSDWFSAPGIGIYLSAIVNPRKNPNELALITRLGAEAVIAAIDAISGQKAKIKLPNDVLLNGKKISGILVERLASGHVIIGIGVNLNHSREDFPPELQATATSLKTETGQNFVPDVFADLLVSALDLAYLAYLG